MQHTTSISFEGAGSEQVWKVKDDWLVTTENGDEFVKLPVRDGGFLRFVLGCKTVPRNCSLSGCAPLKELMRLRNEAQRDELKMGAEGSEEAPKLFKRKPLPKRKARKSVADVQNMRDHPSAIAVTIPGADGEDATVHFLRPAHPLDELAVKMEPGELEHLVNFIRRDCREAGALMDAKRSYGYAQSELNAPRGVWRMGNGRLFEKKGGDSEGQKYRRVSTSSYSSSPATVGAADAADAADTVD